MIPKVPAIIAAAMAIFSSFILISLEERNSGDGVPLRRLGILVDVKDAPTCCPVTLFLKSLRPVYRRCTMPEHEGNCA